MGYYPVTETPYDQTYFDKYVEMGKTTIGKQLNDFRVQTVNAFFPHDRLIDIGIGCGDFIQARDKMGHGYFTTGYDVNPVAIDWLLKRGLFTDPYNCYPQAVSFWDSFEHINEPELLLNRVRSYVFMSIPIFRDLNHAANSKHFRPDEHYWYFTDSGLIMAMLANGFNCVWHSTMETAMGREDIGSYVFKRI